MKISVFFLAIFSLLFFACNNETNITSPATKATEIVPLSIGNTWTYKLTTYDSLENIVSTSIDSFSVVSVTEVVGNNRYTLSTGAVRWNNDLGFWMQMPPDSVLLYKYPVNVGDRYSTGIKVICKDSSITVPAGTFKCYGYSGTVAIDYVSPGVGLVKEEWFLKNSNGEDYLYQKKELLNFKVN